MEYVKIKKLIEIFRPEWRVRVPPHTDENAPLRPLMVVSSKSRPSPGRDGLGFLVKFPVSIGQIGLSKKAAVEYFASNVDAVNMTVELFDVLSGDVLSTVNYSRDHLKPTFLSDDGYLYLPIEEQILPRSFEGVVRIGKNNLS